MCDPQRKNDNNKTTEFILKVRPGGGNWSAVSAEQGDGAMPVEAHASCGAVPRGGAQAVAQVVDRDKS